MKFQFFKFQKERSDFKNLKIKVLKIISADHKNEIYYSSIPNQFFVISGFI